MFYIKNCFFSNNGIILGYEGTISNDNEKNTQVEIVGCAFIVGKLNDRSGKNKPLNEIGRSKKSSKEKIPFKPKELKPKDFQDFCPKLFQCPWGGTQA